MRRRVAGIDHTKIIWALIGVLIAIVLLPFFVIANDFISSQVRGVETDNALDYLKKLGYTVWADPEGNVIPAGDNTFDIGTEDLRFKDAYFSGTVNADSVNAPTGRTATYVIAASDAPAKVKAQADYVGEANIATAITAAEATGGTVILYGLTKPTTQIVPDNVLVIQEVNGVQVQYLGDKVYYPSRAKTQIDNHYYDVQRELDKVGWSYISRFETTANWVAGPDATVAGDATNYVEGTQGVKLTTIGQATRSMTKTVSLDMSSAKHITFNFFVHDITTLPAADHEAIRIRLQSNSDWANYYTTYIVVDALVGGWNKLSLGKANFTSSGSPSWNSITAVRLFISPATGQDTSITFDDMRLVNSLYEGKLILRFDDSVDTDYTIAKPRMDAYGFKGVSCIVPAYVGGSGRLSLAQLSIMQDCGWDIISHSYNHSVFSTLTTPEFINEMAQSQRWLIDNGFQKGARFYAPRGNNYNQEALALIMDNYVLNYGISKARTFNMQLPVSTPQLMGGWINVESATELATVTDFIDRVIANREVGSLLFHSLTGMEDLFDDILAYIDSSGIEVITLSDIVDGKIQPQFTNSGTATIASGATSIVVNHGLATTPTRVQVTPTLLSNANKFWVTNKTSTQFTINVDSDPGEGTAKFDWRAVVGEGN